MNKQARCTLTCLTAAGGLGVASGSISVPFKVLWGGKIGAEKETGAHFRWVGRCSLSLGTGGNGRTTLALWGPGPFLMISFAAVTSLLHG